MPHCDFSVWSEKGQVEPSRISRIHADRWTWPEKEEKGLPLLAGFGAQWEHVKVAAQLSLFLGTGCSMGLPLAICVCAHSAQHSRALTLGRAAFTSKEPRQKSFWIKCAVAIPLTSTHYLVQPADIMPRKAAWPPLRPPFSSMEISFGVYFFPGLAFAGLSLVAEARAASALIALVYSLALFFYPFQLVQPFSPGSAFLFVWYMLTL